MKYIQATVSTTSEFADTLSVILIDFGSEGVSVTDCQDIKRVLSSHTWDYADESLLSYNDTAAYVSGYYPKDYDFSELSEKLNDLRSESELNVGSLELSITEIDSADYENEWKKYYVPIELDKLVIVPVWLKYEGSKIPVFINPGMAFGTGSHETTKLCLEFLEHENIEGERVADIGCGSGILGAAALKLGAKSCYMSDIDEQAVEAAGKNCEINKVSDRAEIHKGSVPENSEGEFSVITANITADVLISLKDSFFNALCDGGKLIMSGIIHSRAKDVTNAFESKFELISRENSGEWQGMLWRKK